MKWLRMTQMGEGPEESRWACFLGEGLMSSGLEASVSPECVPASSPPRHSSSQVVC